MKSSLRPEVVNRLPYDKKRETIVYHRPQVGSGVLLKGGPRESLNRGMSEVIRLNGKYVANTKEFRHSEYENPAVDAMKAFDSQPMVDNYYQTRRLVLTFNHPSRRDYDRIGEYRIAYYHTLADCNMCYYCKKPLKVRKARVTGDSRKPADSWFAPEQPTTKLEKRFGGGKRIRSVAGKPLSGLRYKPHSPASNIVYGDIKSHFEFVPYKNEQGEIKYRFEYIDGSKRRIEQRKRENGVRYFVQVMPDGSEKEIIPHRQYRKTGLVCKCKGRRKR